MPAPNRHDEWTLVQRGRRQNRPRNIPPLVSQSFRREPTMRRSYAAVADPYGRDWDPRDSSPRASDNYTRPARGRSPHGPTRYPPPLMSHTYRPAPSPRRDERHRGLVDEHEVFRQNSYDRELRFTAPTPGASPS